MAKNIIEVIINAKADVTNAQKAFQELFNKLNQSGISDNNRTRLASIYQGITDAVRNYEDALVAAEKTGGKLNANQLKDLDRLSNYAQSAINKFLNFYNNLSDKELTFDLSKFKDANFQALEQKFKTSVQSLQSELNKLLQSFGGNFRTSIDKALSGYGENIFSNFLKTLNSGDPGKIANSFFDLKDKIKQAIKEIEEALKANPDSKQQSVLTERLEELKKLSTVLNSTSVGNQGKNLVTQLTANIQNLLKELGQLGPKAQQALHALEGHPFGDLYEDARRTSQELNHLISTFTRFTTLSGIFAILTKSIRSAFNAVKELDEAMNSIAVVTDLTTSSLWSQIDAYTQMASATGSTIKGAYEVAQLYYQQGLNTKDVMIAAEETLKMARIAQIEYADATDYATAAIKGFNLAHEDLSHINDVYSNLAAKTAADTEEISIAMSKVASIAHSTGMELETTAAFLTQIIATTREAPETAGTALKTVIARFAEVNKLISQGSTIGVDEEGAEVDVNKIETALRIAGVSLRDTAGQMRDLDDVFIELASRWSSLDTIQQRYIATQAAGSRQQSRFLALMNDYDGLMETVGYATDAAGASMEQFDKTMESLQTKLHELSNQWVRFTTGITNSDVIKGVIDILTKLLETVNNITEGFGKLDSGAFTTLSRIVLLFSGLKLGGGAIGSAVTKVFPNLDPKQLNITTFNAAASELLLVFKKLFSMKPQDLFGKVGQTAKKAASGITGVKAAAKGFLGSISMYVMIGTAIIEIIKLFTVSTKEADQAYEQLSRTINETNVELQSLETTFSQLSSFLNETDEETVKLADDFEKLLAGVDANGNNISLTEAQYTKFSETCNSLAEIMPELIEGYDSNTQAISRQKEKLAELLELKREETKIESQRQAREATSDFFDNAEILKANDEMYQIYSKYSNTQQKMIGAGYETQSIQLSFDTEEAEEVFATALENLLKDTEKFNPYSLTGYDRAAQAFTVSTEDYINNQEALRELMHAHGQSFIDLSGAMNSSVQDYKRYEQQLKEIDTTIRETIVTSLKAQDEWYELSESFQNIMTHMIMTSDEYGANAKVAVGNWKNIAEQAAKASKQVAQMKEATTLLIEEGVQEAFNELNNGEQLDIATILGFLSAPETFPNETYQEWVTFFEAMVEKLAQALYNSTKDISLIQTLFGDSFSVDGENLVRSSSTPLTFMGKDVNQTLGVTSDAENSFGIAVEAIADATNFNTDQVKNIINTMTPQLAAILMEQAATEALDAAKYYTPGMNEQQFGAAFAAAHRSSVLREGDQDYISNTPGLDAGIKSGEYYKFDESGNMTKAVEGEVKSIQDLDSAFVLARVDAHKLVEQQKELTSTIEESKEVFADSEKGTWEYQEAINKLADEADDVFGSMATPEFVEEYLDEFTKLTEGGEEAEAALATIQEGLQKNFESAFINTRDLQSGALEKAQGLINYLQNANINVGATLDTGPFMEGIALTDEQMTLLSQRIQALGFSAVWVPNGTNKDGLTSYNMIVTKTGTSGLTSGGKSTGGGGGGGGSKEPAKAEQDPFYNYIKQVEQYEHALERLENQWEITTDPSALKENLEEQEDALTGAMAANQAYLTEVDTQLGILRDQMSKKYGEYMSFAEDGSIRLSEKYFNATGKVVEEMDAWIDQYDDILGRQTDLNNELDDYKKQLKDLWEGWRDDYIDLTDQIAEIYKERDEKILSDKEEYYEALEEQDQKYLDSVRKNIEAERKARQKAKSYEDIADKQKRLALLERDTSGRYSSEVLQLREEIGQSQQEMADQEVDDMLDALERQMDEDAEQHKEILEAMQQQIDENVENRVYIERAEATIAQGDQAILGVLMSSEEFLQTSTANQQKMIDEWGPQIVGAQEYIEKGFTKVEDYLDSFSSVLDTAYDKLAQAIGEIQVTVNNYGSGGGGGGSSGGDSNTGTKTQKWDASVSYAGVTAQASSSTSEQDAIIQVLSKWYDSYTNRKGRSPTDEEYTIARSYVKVEKKYKKGGLVNYTGPAWVDGTPGNPEAFLNADQTRIIGEFAQHLSRLVNHSTLSFSAPTQSVSGGDCNITIEIGSLGADYDIDKAIGKVKDEIMRATSYRGINIVKRTR